MHIRHNNSNKTNYAKTIRNIFLILFIAFISVPISFSKYTSTISEQLSLNIRKPEYDIVYNSNFFPDGYKEVEYIESTGTQYIDTGYIPKTNTKLELTLSFSGNFSPAGTNEMIFFSAANINDDFFGLNFGGRNDEYNTLYPWPDTSYYLSGDGEPFIITDDIRTNKNTIIMENGKITYGNAGRNITSKSHNQTASMTLFGTTMYGTPTPFGAYNMKVYRLKLYENDILVREYVPCYRISDNAVGLYELVNNVFYPNIGTGTFNKGNDIATSGTMSNQHFVYNIAQNIKDNSYSRAGYTFVEWNTKKDGTGISYEEGQSVSELTEEDSATVDLYGQWIFVEDDEIEEENKLKDEITVWVGDSLMAGYGNAKGGFGNYFKEVVNADNSNVGQIAQGGSTISNNTPQTSSKPYPIIRNQIDFMVNNKNTYQDTEIICMDGGGNDVMMYDLNLLNSSYKKPIGQVNNTITTPTTGNTVIADFEEILNEIKTEFPNTKVLYVQPFDYSREHIEDIVFAYVTGNATNVTEVNANLNSNFPTINANFSTMEAAKTWSNTTFNTQITEMVNRGNQLFTEIPKALNKFGYDYLDLTPYFGSDTNQYYQSDKVHITDLAYRTLTSYIISKMEEICE